MNKNSNTRPPTRRQALSGLLGTTLLAAGCSGGEPNATPTASTTTTSAPPSPRPPALGAFGANTGHPLATDAAMAVLTNGGNAVDAAIAAAFADAVMQPASSGIGGGGVSIVVRGDQRANHDYREVVARSGKVPASGVGTPGFVAGMADLHSRYGTQKWADLLEPAIAIAEEGGPVSGYFADTLATALGRRVVRDLEHFHRKDGTVLRRGDILIQKELAKTMRLLAAEGAQAFYSGPLTAQLAKVPGLDAASLKAYEIQHSTPASGALGDYTFLSGAPALPGGAIIQMAQIAEALGVGKVAPDSAEFIDMQSRGWQVAERSVHRWFGDPDFVDVPLEDITDRARNAALAASLKREPRARTGPDNTGDPNTTHISVIDAEGMAVSMTNTITSYWGSQTYTGGFFLNDQLGRFDLIGNTTANRPQPGRRSVTWSSPSMVLDSTGRPALVIGAPGGSQIPNTTASVVLQWVLLGQNLDQAVPAPRFKLDNGLMRLESNRHVAALQKLGYRTKVMPKSYRASWGSVQALAIDWEARAVTGVADTRRSAGVAVSN
ncbi:gamma-glutamyltransferase [Janibacter sp. HTCC2649]|uniref:gamma-glutamyltransferase n=1 Tax=Janibacter sp. HTCC2649 TaxID=313589 RepID=UPI0011D25887|nr:gamma-glutamyltransferase [Janibacter sp. HTCC2649]